jgi:hypothetical protein
MLRLLPRRGRAAVWVALAVLLSAPRDAAAQAASSQAAAPEANSTEKATWYQDHPVASEKAAWVPGEGLEFESQNGLFSLSLRLRAQFLYALEQPYDREAGQYGDLEQGVSIRRARVVFGGHMWGEKTQYKVELAISPADLGMTGSDNPPMTNQDQWVSRSLLLDWYMQFNQIRDLNVRVGQSKVPFSRDRVVSSGDLQFVDRTLLNSEFNIDRDIGVDVRSKDLFGLGGRLRYYLGIYNGEGHSAYQQSDFGLMYLGRIEVLPFGKMDDYRQGDVKRSQQFGASFGAAYARIENAKGSRGILGSRPADGGVTDFDMVTADVSLRYRGISVEGAYFYRRGVRRPGSAVDDTGAPIAAALPRDGWGAGVQAGYLLPSIDLEFAGRYSAVRAADGETALRDNEEAGVACSYYLAQHAYKIQADFHRYWGPGARGAGTRFADGGNLFRLQLQAAF